jgi:hypothetical protein
MQTGELPTFLSQYRYIYMTKLKKIIRCSKAIWERETVLGPIKNFATRKLDVCRHQMSRATLNVCRHQEKKRIILDSGPDCFLPSNESGHHHVRAGVRMLWAYCKRRNDCRGIFICPSAPIYNKKIIFY